MRKTGKESLMRRVKQFDTINVTQPVVDRVCGILSKYDEPTVRKASRGAAAFYVWVRTLVQQQGWYGHADV